MCRNVEIAAQVFVEALDAETIEKMKQELLVKAENGDERPDPSTRLGLAFIAFTTPNIMAQSDEEIAHAREEVASLWTEEERRNAY